MQPELSSEPSHARAPAAGEPLRLALVIGNSIYQRAGRLRTAANDADAVAERLIELGFTVRSELDLDADRFARVIETFIAELAHVSNQAGPAQPTAAVLYYAGHAIQVQGHNYLLPVDGAFDTETDLQHRAIPLDDVLMGLRANATTAIVLLDCCHANPMRRLLGPDGQSRSLAVHDGLAEVEAPRGVFLAYSTQPDTIAVEGQARLSPFGAALARHLGQPDMPVEAMMSDVRREVSVSTAGRQLPWDRSALTLPFAFRPLRASSLLQAPAVHDAAPTDADRALEYWALIEKTGSPDLLRSFLHQFPRSPHRPLAIARIDELRLHGWRQRLAGRAVAVVLGLAAVAASYVGIEYARFSDAGGLLTNAMIVGNDIDVPVGAARATSLVGCRIGCILSPRCVAITWTPTGGVCSRKLAATHFVRTAAVGRDAGAHSEYIRRRGAALPEQMAAGTSLHFDRTLAGEPLAKAKVTADPTFLDPDGRSPLREEGPASKFYWRVTNAACHQRCDDLKGECNGFSFTPIGNRCQLFGTVKGLARDADGHPVHTPSVHSACWDTTAADCGARR